MKTVKHEIKLETSVKIILGVLALGIFLNVFATPVSKELFGVKNAWGNHISGTSSDPYFIKCLSGCN